MKTKEELESLLQNLPKARIGVIGDFCIDAYWFIDEKASEVSVETGLRTRPVQRQRYTLGGAGNVVMNLLDLAVGKVAVYGVVGPDPFGYQMRQLLNEPRVDLGGLMTRRRSGTRTFTPSPASATRRNGALISGTSTTCRRPWRPNSSRGWKRGCATSTWC